MISNLWCQRGSSSLRSNKIYVGLFLIRQNLSGGVRLLREPTLVYSMCQGIRRDGRSGPSTSSGQARRGTEGRGKKLE